MTPWVERTREEQGLLNPSFCALLLWHAAVGFEADEAAAMPFEESFLVLPLVLHRGTREALPRSSRTSLAVWLQEHPLTQGRVATLAQALVPFTKEALMFAGVRGFITLDAGTVHAEPDWQRTTRRVLRQASDEVTLCAKRAEFVGKWFAQTGSSTTVLALLGVRP